MPRSNRSLVYQLLERFCAQRGLNLSAGDPYGHAGLIESPTGQRWFFKGTRFDLNGLGASEIANDKAYAAKFLAKNGVAVPATCFVPSAEILDGEPLPENLAAFIGDLGLPLFVKPNIGQEGQDVVRVNNIADLQAALLRLAKRHNHLLVQKEIRGQELRIVVLDDEILCAIERRVPVIVGDGMNTIAELLKNNVKADAEDERIVAELAAQGLTLESIPEAGLHVSLLPVTNLSSGGTASIVTREIGPEVLSLAQKAARTLSLRYAGVDLIVPDDRTVRSPAIILEVNAAPGLSNLARQGPEEAALVERIYEKLFEAMFAN